MSAKPARAEVRRQPLHRNMEACLLEKRLRPYHLTGMMKDQYALVGAVETRPSITPGLCSDNSSGKIGYLFPKHATDPLMCQDQVNIVSLSLHIPNLPAL